MTTYLRPYQANLAARALQVLSKSGSVLIQLETGAGKTHIAAEMCRNWASKKLRVWFIAHRREILDQAAKVFSSARVANGAGAEVQFKMVAAAAKRSNGNPAPDVLIFDECHHTPAKTWAGIIEAYPNALRLGLTATPGRLDGASLAEYFAEIIPGPAARDLRAQGFLAGYQYFAPAVPDLSSVKVRQSEYDRGSLTEIMTGAAIVGDVVDHYRRHADGKRAILFAVSTSASRDMAERFNLAGIKARHLDAEVSEEDRVATIEAFRRGEFQVLCNVELFTEGFDLPAIDAVILLRPTRSLGLFRQMIGRGSRLTSLKARTIILDHAALVAEHGLPDEEYEWTLDGKPPRRKIEIEGGARQRMRRCPSCYAVHEWGPNCVECGLKYEGSREVSEINGNLFEFRSIPLGCVTKSQYARMRGIGSSTVSGRIKKGLPTHDGFIHVEKADAWWDEKIRSSGRVSITGQLREGCVSKSEYGRIENIKSQAVTQRIKTGLPVESDNSINIAAANDWIKRHRTEIKEKKEEVTSAIWANPIVRAKRSELTKSQFSDPEYVKKLRSATQAYFSKKREIVGDKRSNERRRKRHESSQSSGGCQDRA